MRQANNPPFFDTGEIDAVYLLLQRSAAAFFQGAGLTHSSPLKRAFW
jgi:hypothetical protein